MSSGSDGLVLSLHAPWGFGKTTFLEMWRKHLRLKGIRTLSFNAWESDYTDDALVALIGEFSLHIADLESPQDKTRLSFKKPLNKLKKLGAKLVGLSLPVALRFASAGVLSGEEPIEKFLSEVGEKWAEHEIQRYEESKRSMEALKQQISEIAKRVTGTEGAGDAQPLVVIIDELDRCRPTYAIRVLECIKHLFSVPGIVFVVAIDRIQLGHSVASQYGVGMDSEGYLRRFFDLELNLPQPTGAQFTESQFMAFELDQYFNQENGSQQRFVRVNYMECFEELFSALQLSLRDRQRAFAWLNYLARMGSQRLAPDPFLASTLIAIKVSNASLFHGLATGHAKPRDIIEFIEKRDAARRFFGTQTGHIVEAILNAAFATSESIPKVISEYTVGRVGVSEDRRKAVLELLKSIEGKRAVGSARHALARLDLISG